MKDNKYTIGILGGMGTYATINVFNQYAKLFVAEKEWDRPRIIIDNRCTMPSRVRAFLYNENVDKLISEMAESMEYLTKAGCTRIILACMTSHLFLPKIYEKVPELKNKIINLIELTAQKINEDNIKNVYLIGSEGTIDSKIIQNELKKYHTNCQVPAQEEYTIIRDCIEAVKQNKYRKDTKEKFLKLMNRSQNVILGCSELPILYQKYHNGITAKNIYDPFKLGIEKMKEEYDNE